MERSSNSNASLEELRQQIDQVDQELVSLLNRRFAICEAIGNAKAVADPDAANVDKLTVYFPSREKEVLAKVERLNASDLGPLTDEGVRNIFQEIMSFSLRLQRHLCIAFVGPYGSQAHQAAMSRFGRSLRFLSCRDSASVSEAVACRKAAYGVVKINDALLDFASRNLSTRIYTEIVMPLSYSLQGRPGVSLQSIRRLYVSVSARRRCSQWIGRELDSVEIIEVTDDATAASKAAQNTDDSAAVCTKLAGEAEALQVIVRSVEDAGTSLAHYVVLALECEAPTGQDTTVLRIGSAKASCGLAECLRVFDRHKVNIRRISSMWVPNALKVKDIAPSLSHPDLQLFVHAEGHWADAIGVPEVMEELSRRGFHVCSLGSFAFNTHINSYS